MIGAYWSMHRHGFFVPILIPVVITVSRLGTNRKTLSTFPSFSLSSLVHRLLVARLTAGAGTRSKSLH